MKKSLKKLGLAFGTLAAVAGPTAALVSCSLFERSGDRSKYSFYNYEDYMDATIQENISATYDYYQFADLPEIENGINDEIVGGAIGSDYFNAQLAGKGKLAKLDFGRLYGISSDRSQWASELKNIYSDPAWNLLTSFRVAKLDNQGNPLDANGERVYDDQGNVISDKNVAREQVYDVDGDGQEDFLWEYMAPYFIQNKVVAVNVDKLATYANAPVAVKQLDADNKHSTISNADFNQLFTDKSYKGILDLLRSWGASKLTVNDYMRDNLMIGAQANNGTFTGFIKGNDYTRMVSGFQTTIAGWNATPISSGIGTLSSLIHAEGSDVKADAALMYNGDALYAWNGGDASPDEDKQQIRIINPSDPSFLLDGYIIPSYVQNDYAELNRAYQVMSSYLFGSATTRQSTAPVTGQVPGVDFNASFISNNNLYRNFDSVNYTPAFRQLYNYVDQNYFTGEDGSVDETARAMFASTQANASKINADHVTQPITNKQLSDATSLYESSKRNW